MVRRQAQCGSVSAVLADGVHPIPGTGDYPVGVFVLPGSVQLDNHRNTHSTGQHVCAAAIRHLPPVHPEAWIPANLRNHRTRPLVLIWKHYASKEGFRLLQMAQWIGAFSIVYILLLPLRGYREYRDLILRYDTIMPITLALMVIMAASAVHILKVASPRYRRPYMALLVGFARRFRSRFHRG